MIVSLLLGVLVGIVLGLTGAGGGILAVPALVFGLGWSMQQAAPVALIAVAGAALVGAAEGLHLGVVRYRAAALMAAAGIPFTLLGVRAAHHLSQPRLGTAFAGVMLLVAFRMLRAERQAWEHRAEADHGLARIDRDTGRIRWSWPTAALIAAIGAATGFITGLLGVGGGFVIVPMLRRHTGIGMHGVVATSLMVIALVSGGGVALTVLNGADMPWRVAAWFAAATAAGMLAGRQLVRRLPPRQVQYGFGATLACVALAMLGRSLWLLA
ncbi:MAG: sulfite exporter TauE/SafE family protein [Nevskia sp.]|nr:sulfite exporter TauE/SafE family protein [Nevskia sp.]